MEEKNFEEISLRELIGILLKYKVLILVIVSIALLLSLAYAFLIAESIYQAEAEIEILSTNTGISSFDQEDDKKIIIDTYAEWVGDNRFLEKVSDRLESEDIDIDSKVLNDIIKANKGKDGKSISLVAKYKHKAEAAPIINAVVAVITEEAAAHIREQLNRQMLIVDEQIEQEELTYEKALSKYKEYASTPDSLSRLQTEKNIYESLIVELKAYLISGNIGQGQSKQKLMQDIAEIEENIVILQNKLFDSTYLDRTLIRSLNSSLERYESFSEEKEKLERAYSYYRDNSNIAVLSYGVEPDAASSPNRKVIILESLVIGMVIAILAAFTIEYFKNGK